jgi:hypothetical protein
VEDQVNMNMDAFDMVRLLRVRQNAILDCLPDALCREYQEIESAIRHIDGLLAEKGAAVKIDLPSRVREILEQRGGVNLQPSRVPLVQRRLVLEDYLRTFGPAKRGQILMNTKIPPGTLSTLLQNVLFEKTTDGLWRIKEQPKT